MSKAMEEMKKEVEERTNIRQLKHCGKPAVYCTAGHGDSEDPCF